MVFKALIIFHILNVVARKLVLTDLTL